jgi:hypothetical protein
MGFNSAFKGLTMKEKCKLQLFENTKLNKKFGNQRTKAKTLLVMLRNNNVFVDH